MYLRCEPIGIKGMLIIYLPEKGKATVYTQRISYSLGSPRAAGSLLHLISGLPWLAVTNFHFSLFLYRFVVKVGHDFFLVRIWKDLGKSKNRRATYLITMDQMLIASRESLPSL